MSAEALSERARQWKLFAAWEAQSEAVRERSLSADLGWLSDALELSRRLAPDEDDLAAVRERAAHRARIRAALTVLGRRAE
jgi:hypothetical protein